MTKAWFEMLAESLYEAVKNGEKVKLEVTIEKKESFVFESKGKK